jgi:ABC-2 type transport system permease protein
MIHALSAEWLKLRKRPAIWVLGGVLLGLVILLTYGALFLVLLSRPRGLALGRGVTLEDLRQSLYPVNFVRQALSSAGGFGGPIALILGVLVAGSEYSWSTLKTVLTQWPSRLAVYAAKLVATAGVLAVFTVAVFATALACSLLIGAYYGAPIGWPALADLAKGLLAYWLVLSVWAALGLALAVLFRQSALAIGLGLVYSIALESIVFGILGRFDWARGVERVFPGANATALVQAFGSASRAAANAANPPLVGANQAIAVLAAYLALFVLVGAALLRQRDVV